MARAKKSGDSYNLPFPKNLRALMESHPDTTQEKLAEITGKTRQTVSQYVNGISEPGFDTLVKIADYFNCSIDYLLGRTNDPTISKRAVDDLGITPNASEWIMEQRKNSEYESSRIEILNLLLESRKFSDLFKEICDFYYAVKAQTAYDKIFDIAFPQDGERMATIQNQEALLDGLRRDLQHFNAEIEVKEWMLAIMEDNDSRVSGIRRTMFTLKKAVDVPDILKYNASILFSDLLDYIEENAKSWDMGDVSIQWGDSYGND